MNKKALVLAALAALATGARADYTFDFSTDATDSAAVNASYNAKTFSDDQTTTTLKVTSGVMRIDVAWANVPKWGANAGILLPLNSMWSVVDMSGLTGVTFSYRTSDLKTSMQFSLNSPLWTSVANDASGKGDGVVRTYASGASTSWKTVTIDPSSDLVWLDWMTKQHAEEATQAWADVSSQVKNLQFQPMPNYSTDGSTVTPSTGWMEVKNVSMTGNFNLGGDWDVATGSCTSSFVTLSDANNKVANQNQFNGYWYAFTDTTAGPQGNANGTTKLDTSTSDAAYFGQGLWYQDLNGNGLLALGIKADFNKKDAAGTWEPYAGWADIGTNLDTATSGKGAVDLTGLTAIGFHIQMGDGMGGEFDNATLGGVTFKVGKSSVPDSVQYQFGMDYASVSKAGANGIADVCIAASDLHQPGWYNAKNPVVAFSPKDVTKFLWEMKIQDQKKPTISSATTSSVWITDLRLYGINPRTGISGSKAHGVAALSANYNRGLILSYDLEGAQNARIDVVRLDGSKVASFARSETTAKNLALPVSLSQGTYLVVVKGGKSNLVAPVSVLH